jgi:hypothetical protein
MRTQPFNDSPMPDFSAINRSIAWMTDPTLPALLEKTYQVIITNRDARPFFLVAYDALSEITGYNKRLNVAYQLKDRLLNYLKSRYMEGEELDKQSDEFESLIHYLQMLDHSCSHCENIYKLYRDNPNVPTQKIDAIVYYHFLQYNDHKDEFLWLSQAKFHFAHIEKDESVNRLYLPLYVHLFKDKYVASPAINFCQSLLETQQYIQQILKGDKCEPVTVKSFPIELRNYCFDQYIENKADEALKILSEDNDRPDPATTYEAKMELLSVEESVFDDSADDPDTNPEAVHMAQYLMDRLKDDLGIVDTSSAKSQPYCTYISPNAPKPREEIEADIVMASKRSAQRFANRLLAMNRLGYLDFLGDTPKEVFDYLHQRYDLPYSAENFVRYFRSE